VTGGTSGCISSAVHGAVGWNIGRQPTLSRRGAATVMYACTKELTL
jgi:hypothetical protein